MSFWEKMGPTLPTNLHLKLRTRYLLPLDLDKRRGVLQGFCEFYNNLRLKGGEFLVFEYYGHFGLNVYILGSNCSEIEYPPIVHENQTCNPLRGNISAFTVLILIQVI